MSEVTRSIRVRVLAVVGVYALIVTVAAVSFQSTRDVASSGPHLHYMIYGPALALLTHMSYVSFALQSVLLLPWLLWSVLRPRGRTIALAGFCTTWLALGWSMHDLF